MDTETRDATVAITGCIGLIPAVVLGYILRGWVLNIVWTWFITPVFHIAAPGNAMCIGLGIATSYLVGFRGMEVAKNDKSVVHSVSETYMQILLTPFLTLFIAWVIRHWV